MLTSLDKRVIARLQEDLPLTRTPYADLAKELGMTEDELLSRLQWFKETVMLRRVGAVLSHRRAGYTGNVLCAWRVPADQVEEAGRLMASFPQASHVYQRPVYPDWPYNIYTMIHGRSRQECEAVVEEIAQKTGIKEYALLYSVKEFKKSSMKYF